MISLTSIKGNHRWEKLQTDSETSEVKKTEADVNKLDDVMKYSAKVGPACAIIEVRSIRKILMKSEQPASPNIRLRNFASYKGFREKTEAPKKSRRMLD